MSSAYVAPNNGSSTLATAITTSSQTVISLASGHGVRFPSPTGGDYTLITLENGTTREIVSIVGRTTDTLTVGVAGSAAANSSGRGLEGTSAGTWAIGTIVSCRMTAALVARAGNAKTAAELAAAGGAALIGNTPAGNIAATTVQAAINELDTEKAQLATLAAAGGAALIGNTPAGNIAATTVQAAINELDTEKAKVGALGSSGITGAAASGVNSDITSLLGLTGPINEARGTVAMHATTMDLWSQPNVIDGTGSAVTITAIANAPQAGARRTLYPITGTVITNGATFAVDGAANYTTAAGDALEFEAVTTSTYKVHIKKADGTAVVAPAIPTVSAAQGAFKNLQLSAGGLAASISVSYDELILGDGTGAYSTERSVSGSIATTNSGTNGLDTGTIAASTWYSIWRIGKTDGTRAWLFSLSATAPTMPSGYTLKARIGWFRTDGTVNKYPFGFTQSGRSVQYKVATGSNVTAYPTMASGTQGSVMTPTWVAVGVSNFVPSTASRISVTAAGSGANFRTMIAPNNSFGAIGNATNPAPFMSDNTSGYTVSFSLETTNIYIAQQYSVSGQSMCVGWEDNI